MIYFLSVAASDSKTDRLPNAIHDFAVSARSAEPGISSKTALLPASNIESNATLVDRIFVRDHSADWHGIAIVMVGHQRNLIGCLETRLDLAKCAFIRRTPHWNVVD
jgi:hypothetical protein